MRGISAVYSRQQATYFTKKIFSLHCLLQEEKTEANGEDALDTALLEHHVTQSDITRLTMTNQSEDHNAGRFDD